MSDSRQGISALQGREDVKQSEPVYRTAASILLQARGLAKSFGATRALRDCSLELRPGEVHAVVGENGSGKSTLVKVLCGVHRADQGEIELDGVRSSGFPSPRHAARAGVVAVYQEVLVLGPRTVSENVWVGSEGLFRPGAPVRVRQRGAEELLGRLLDKVPGGDVAVEDLSLSERQACCIARALMRRPRVLLLDEATSALDFATRNRLFEVVSELKSDGVGVIFTSHRMDEISSIADRITVMRAGESVGTLGRGEASAGELVRLMTGSAGAKGVVRPERKRRPGARILSARGVGVESGSKASLCDFELREGEIVGLAGLEGHGQEAFLASLAGRGARGTVMRHRGAHDVVLRSPRKAASEGIAYVPRERRAEGLFEPLSVLDNFALPTLTEDRRYGFVSARRSERRLSGYVQQLNIRLGSARDPIARLSGGNQQKVVISRWLAARPTVLLLNDPTRGIDPAAKQDTYRLLDELAQRGLGIVMLSTEVDELCQLMDRVLVFRNGGVVAELARQELCPERLVSSFFGLGGDERA